MNRPRGPIENDPPSDFESAMDDVSPLPPDPHRPPGDPPERASRTAAAESTRFEIEHDGERRTALAPGADSGQLKRLRRGEIAVDRRLDLHGIREEEARRQFLASFEDAASEGVRCLLVVHGRGLHSAADPVLKEALLDWVQEPRVARHMLALSSAHPRDGGAGATYLLLRRKRS